MDNIEHEHVWRRRVPLLLITLGAFLLRLYSLGSQSLWYDETVSAYLASQSVPQILAHAAGDIHPPLYYLLLHLWVNATGDSEWALAYLSVFFGTLLVPLGCALSRRLLGSKVALWTAALLAISPFHIWYSQEVRMYTLGSALGMIGLWLTLEIVDPNPAKREVPAGSNGAIPPFRRFLPFLGFTLTATLGLLVLYYFSFFLIALNLFVITFLILHKRYATLGGWLVAQAAAFVLYLPWFPIAWRQATNPPVPPWRGLVPFPAAAAEIWTALSFGQSVEPRQVWPLLLLTAALLVLGILYASSWHRLRQQKYQGMEDPNPTWLLLTCLFGPVLLVYGLSLVTPLYHVRYMVLYSSPFYVLLGAGIAFLSCRSRLLAVASVATLVAGSLFSILQMHTNPHYAADDLRGAVSYLAQHWRPGDAILLNAGYTYPAFLHYYDQSVANRVRLAEFQYQADAPNDQALLLQTGIIGGDPSLGWGNPASDFYATTEQETDEALSRVAQSFSRLWVLRLYDTVSDPNGYIREWLPSHMIPFEDRTFEGPSYAHVQGFMSESSPPSFGQEIELQSSISVLGWEYDSSASPGSELDVTIWWLRELADSASQNNPYAASLKLWGNGGDGVYLAAQQDEWPAGSLLLTPDWPQGQTIRYPMRVSLPADLAPGQYWLDLEMYDIATTQPLLRLDGQGHAIPLGSVTVD